MVISGEERKGSGLLRKDSASRSAPAHDSPALLTRGCQFANMAKTATSIVRFRSAMITVLVIIDRVRRHRRIGSIEGVPPLLVRVRDDDSISPIEGHCRRRGAMLAISRGAKLLYVDCEQFTGSDAERTSVMLRSGEGLKFKPLEVALGYLRLKRQGYDNNKIASEQKKTVARVEQLLLLATANHDVHALVREGKVAAEAAIEAVRKHANVTGAELVAPAPRAALENFPQDVPLRGPAPLEDQLPS